MPELPEVETVRRGLLPVMEGHRILAADIRRPDLRWPFPSNMQERLEGQTVRALRRRSKYLLCDLSGGETLIWHLGMSGRVLIALPEEDMQIPGQFAHVHAVPEKHDHVVMDLDQGARVTFNDARRFGAMDLAETARLDAHKMLAGLGPEPLGNAFHEDHLIAAFAGRAAPVKAALLDQKVVAGLGNIYVCEALHRAGIAPTRAAGRISKARVAALVPVIRNVLEEAIAAGGSTLKDHRQPDGELGYFQHTFQVYGRDDAPCLREGCDGTVRRIVQSGRSSFHCPRCQR